MQAVKPMQDELYISYSQMFTYQTCSLKYKFQYVEQRPQERISCALPFGKAIHSALELYYRDMKNVGSPPQLERVLAVFKDRLVEQIESSTAPVIYKKEAPNLAALLTMGEGMLTVFCKKVDLSGYKIIGIELPLSAPLFTEDRAKLDIRLFGVIDLLLKDSRGHVLCMDNKTSKQAKSQSAVDDDLQLTTYSYLLAANGYTFPRAQIQCGFQVLRKVKEPSIEYYTTTRTAEHRRRFAKLAGSILQGIEHQLFFPTPSFMCADCQYRNACKNW